MASINAETTPGSVRPLEPKRRGSKEKDSGRSTKHRASQACHACRLRKVRCDVLTNGPRCTNCRLDNTECVVLPSRRGKNNRSRHERVEGRSPVPPKPLPFNVHSNSGSMHVQNAPRREGPATSPTTGEVPVCVTFDEDAHDEDHSKGLQTPDQVPSIISPNPSIGSISQDPRRPSTIEGLPSFISPLPGHLLREDLEFLVQKGAFLIPEAHLQSKILQSYIFSIHPFMPILDLRALFRAVYDGQRNDHISILLFQAIMFAGLAAVDPEVINSMGFQTPKEAREHFFNRVRLLYEFDVEPSELAVLQSLLLMSWWYGSPKQRRHTWHWTGLAFSVALNMGLHREPTGSRQTDEERHFRRRLWWSLYIRDRLLALGTRRPMRIRDDSFNVSMLTIEDFEIDASTQLALPDVEDIARTSLICVELAKLCVCIGHVLSSQYTDLETQADVPPTMMVVPKRPESSAVGLNSCDEEIANWYQNLLAAFNRFDSPPRIQNGMHSCYEVHWAVLNMLYLTLVNVLHRTQALQHSPDDASAQATQRSSRAKVKDAARSATKIAHTMLRRNQVRYMGVPGVTALIAACLSHILDIRSDNEDVRDASVFRFYQTMQVLQSLRSIYASADSAVSFLASVIRKAGISVPEQISSVHVDAMSTCSDRAATTRNYASDYEGPSAYEGRRRTIAPLESGVPATEQARQPLTQQSPAIYFPQPQPRMPFDQQAPPLLSEMSTWGFNMADLGTAPLGQFADPSTGESFFEWTNNLSLDVGMDMSGGIGSDVDYYRGTYDLFA
ncbi:hypothetical protein DPSP01_008539 [Paraphaeosphaeria sporulosa]|uniref:Zn(2)-C6 fungal-type domain-containing protein n=1 Tax=Paraphaeosphaeria sporulosa TaxID=1460663 RepID=A0A177CRV0_9PLEO|nr:uncharacterized protein CC84DRAFT_1137562 [Paraphaeosphaeria sporulosa]OAG09698.1 hypothetical protein CC84DRAFT_1137562 [Paraphaeosphaeria sporulosa]